MSQKIPAIRNKKLLKEALTHRSYANENPEEGDNNERLEFLGDAILGFLVGELLFKKYPQMSEAQLTRLRSKLVDETQLGKIGKEIGLGELMQLGKGAQKDQGQENPSLLSDTFEAMIGAYFLDSGIEAVRDYVQTLFSSVAESFILPLSNLKGENLVDTKNRFQQWSLAQFGENPEYVIIAQSGPDHAKEFTAEVRVKGKVYGIGQGRRKQQAQKCAAEVALKHLGIIAN